MPKFKEFKYDILSNFQTMCVRFLHFCHTKYTCKHDDNNVKRFCPKFLKTTHQSHKNLLMAFNRLSTLAWIFRHTCLRGEEDTFFCITYQEVSIPQENLAKIELSKNKITFYDVCLIALLPLRERMKKYSCNDNCRI